jgi:hypothetical protein
MGSDLRQRIFLVARVAAALIAVGYVLTIAARAGGGHQSAAVPTASPAPASPTQAVATPTGVMPAPVSPKTLCQAVPSLVQLSVQALYLPLRDGGVNVSNSVTVTGTAVVHALARQLCALPPAPADPAACAASTGHWTQFIFSAADAAYWTVWADTGGCMTVLGVGNQARTAAPDRRLWSTVLADVRQGHRLGSPTR